jgi:hypothetical protein
MVRQPLNKKTKQDSMCRHLRKWPLENDSGSCSFFGNSEQPNQINQGSFQMMMLASYVVVIQHRLC